MCQAAATWPYLHSDSRLWRIATRWHTDAVPSPNCLLSSFWTPAVTLSVCIVCDCCVHIFAAWFLWWLSDTNCLCHQALKIRPDSALTISFCFFFFFHLSFPDADDNKEEKHNAEALLTMWHSVLRCNMLTCLFVGFCHRKVTMVMMGSMVMLVALRKIITTPVHQCLNKKTRWEVLIRKPRKPVT